MDLKKLKVSIIGLGYVGLPLAVAFGKHRHVIGYDINSSRIEDLKENIDKTLETTEEELKNAKLLTFATNINDLANSNCFIVTVPTPIDSHNKPNLKPLIKATEQVAKILKTGDIVIYESTVFPGATEEICVPILEKISGLSFIDESKDHSEPGFYCGYSPERINPGDKEHRLSTITKVVSGSTPKITNLIDELYKEIITVGTYKAESIKVAEAAKVIENTQRDLNIALINELAMIFNKLGIDTNSVLEAAGTKWNFLKFYPGLVGGHCIGVDPYYLTHKAEEIGHEPLVILSGRKVNDQMSTYVSSTLIKKMIQSGIKVNNANILIMGLAFKENCPDIRNTKIVDIYDELISYDCIVDIYDPWVSPITAEEEYGISIIPEINNRYDAIIFAVAHREFAQMPISQIIDFSKENHVIYDLKNILDKNISHLKL